ncbi:MAG TPA: hypothetical protein VF472_09570 [Burkholderiaceae bacterium]
MRHWIKAVVAPLAFSFRILEAAAAPESAEPPGEILFICEHGNVKSLMAVSYFNRVAKERHLPFVAISRGVAPDSATVPPAIVEGLRRQGFDVSSFHPVKVTEQDITSARRAVAIGVPSLSAVGSINASLETWNDVPPATVDFQASSASIKVHIEALLSQLTASRGESPALDFNDREKSGHGMVIQKDLRLR